ncbi:hypothetical protein A7981_06935 [Methylovorus sp. MM2]|uniref:hypothetical protein n=1 Tax=Methylovorus sp. MM2 TaxID=1848038 RepID=UPI0007E23BC0|nr:hypothetical protein [Methylovorus sp. MM2]OAM53140.1 hypothetical protein A7981_06935 [Methylovorus sp. MM2]
MFKFLGNRDVSHLHRSSYSANLPLAIKNIILPYINNIKVRSEADFYGASHNISEFVGVAIKNTLSSWSHGWGTAALKFPEQIAWDQAWKLHRLVRTNKVKNFLSNNGIKNVVAVGLPIIYTENKHIHRSNGSILFMPAHSLSYVDIDPQIDEMVSFAINMRSAGKYVCFCIHDDCLRHGKIIPLLDSYHLDWFVGSSIYDSNSLQRMRNIFSFFEVVASNTIGSHFVYSQLFGAKFFFHEPYFEFKSEQFLKSPVLGKKNELRHYLMDQSSYKIVKEKYPSYFQGYANAVCDQVFAEIECGVPDHVEPKELVGLLGWSLKDQVLYSLPYYSSKMVNKVKAKITRKSS